MKRMYLTEILDEVLGVPEGIIETSKEIYDGIVEQLKNTQIQLSLEEQGGVRLNLENPNGFKIADYIFTEVDVTIRLRAADVDEIDWNSMGFSFSPELNKPYKRFTFNSGGKVQLSIVLIVNPDVHTGDDIVKYFTGNNRVTLMSSLAHELKHAYDKFKKKGEPASSVIRYRAIGDLMTPLPGLKDFMYYLYYTTLTENLVRPTEIAAHLKYSDATKETFLDVLKTTRAYQVLKEAEGFTYDKMIQGILSDPESIPSIESFFEEELEDVSDLSDIDKVKEFLKFHFNKMKTHMSDIFNAMVKSTNKDPFQMMLAQLGIDKEEVDMEKENAMKEFKQAVNRYSGDDYEKFYKNEIALINSNASKTLKKMAKLYSYI